VVDRASQAAYRMLADKIEEGLRCLNGDGTANPTTQFPATCDAIGSIRIQDLAMARDILLRALASDITRAASEQSTRSRSTNERRARCRPRRLRSRIQHK